MNYFDDAILAGSKAIWTVYTNSDVGKKDETFTVPFEDLQKWAVEKGPDNAAYKVITLCRDETILCVIEFLNSLPTAWVRDSFGVDAAVFKNIIVEELSVAYSR